MAGGGQTAKVLNAFTMGSQVKEPECQKGKGVALAASGGDRARNGPGTLRAQAFAPNSAILRLTTQLARDRAKATDCNRIALPTSTSLHKQLKARS